MLQTLGRRQSLALPHHSHGPRSPFRVPPGSAPGRVAAQQPRSRARAAESERRSIRTRASSEVRCFRGPRITATFVLRVVGVGKGRGFLKPTSCHRGSSKCVGASSTSDYRGKAGPAGDDSASRRTRCTLFRTNQRIPKKGERTLHSPKAPIMQPNEDVPIRSFVWSDFKIKIQKGNLFCGTVT